MDILAEILTYLLQRQEGAEFSADKEEILQAQRAVLLAHIEAVLEEDGLSDEARLRRIQSLLARSGKPPCPFSK